MQFNYRKLEGLCMEHGIKVTSLYRIVPGFSVSRSSLDGWTKGATPKISSLKPVADYFKVPISYFYDDAPEMQSIASSDIVSLRVVASVKAGFGGTIMEEYFPEEEQVPIQMLKGYAPSECRLFAVKGDSMYPKILDGDHIIVHLQPSVDSGDVAVVIDEDEGTVKRVNYVQNEDWLELIPINPEYKTKRIEGAALEQCYVFGKVIGLLRSL